jgi:hypothetical protein
MAFEDAPMRFPHQFRMSVTRRGEKEEQLGAFIARNLVLARQGATPRPGPISLLARSLDSPVARAIGTLAAEIAAVGSPVRLLLVKSDRPFPADGCVYPQAAPLDCEARLVRDPRLIEAHEQMVIGPRACWTGDSMRRDPAACDAYESFLDDCPEIAGHAQATFEHLWAAAAPLFGHRPMAAPVGPAAALERCPERRGPHAPQAENA